MKTIIQTEFIEHPMEDVLDLEPCTTLTEYTETIPDVPVEHIAYDDKDQEIEFKLEEVYTAAMGSSNVLSDEIEMVEGKYKARMAEVSATMLNVALSAVREKRQLKEHKDKLSNAPRAPGGAKGVTNQNVIIADRNDILRALLEKK